MKEQEILLNLEFLGQLQSKRQLYYVYEGKNEFVSMTHNPKKDSYNFNVTRKIYINRFHKIFRNINGITTSDIIKSKQKPRFITDAMDTLNILYILCVQSKAAIDHRHKENKLYFNIY